MTNELAIRIITGDVLGTNEQTHEAVTMAVKALSMRKRGKWEMLQMPINPPVYKCSICGKHALQTMTGCLVNRHYEACLTDYCPNCGADMREGGEDDS